MKKSLTILFSALLASACIVGESSHQIYIGPEGGVTWVVHETEIRSISGPEESRAEEERFLVNARVGMHPIARALAGLVPERLDYRVLRADRPFEVRTEARFHSIEELASDVLRQLGIDGTASLRSEDGVTQFEIIIENPCEEDGISNDAILALADELASYRLLMTEGRFVDAVGFELLEEGAVAVPVQADIDCEAEFVEPLAVSLSWKP